MLARGTANGWSHGGGSGPEASKHFAAGPFVPGGLDQRNRCREWSDGARVASAARRRPGVAPQRSSEKSNWYTAIKMVVEVRSSAIDNGHAGKPPMNASALTENSSVAQVSTRLSTKI